MERRREGGCDDLMDVQRIVKQCYSIIENIMVTTRSKKEREMSS